MISSYAKHYFRSFIAQNALYIDLLGIWLLELEVAPCLVVGHWYLVVCIMTQ